MLAFIFKKYDIGSEISELNELINKLWENMSTPIDINRKQLRG